MKMISRFWDWEQPYCSDMMDRKQYSILLLCHLAVIIFKHLFILFCPQLIPSVLSTTLMRAKLLTGTWLNRKGLITIGAMSHLLFYKNLTTALNRTYFASSTRATLKVFPANLTNTLHLFYYSTEMAIKQIIPYPVASWEDILVCVRS